MERAKALSLDKKIKAHALEWERDLKAKDIGREK
jgi:hypothetical protein